MALRGTLGDFSVADIFQLIGHQQKTGTLRVSNRGAEVAVLFLDGSVVGASDNQRSAQDLIGNMMMRADVITEPDLQHALDEHRRSMRRLGDVLVSSNIIDIETLREFTKLQITETIYRLFRWKAGSYEFTPSDAVDFDPASQSPIRAENLLMEAFRIVDEWPSVKRVVPTMATQFSPIRPLPPIEAKSNDDDDILAGFESMMMGEEAHESVTEHPLVGKNERKVYDLVAPGRTAQEIIDRSRLGEFETCKALSNLVQNGFLEARVPTPASTKPKTFADVMHSVTPVVMRIALYAVVALSLAGLLKLYQWQGQGLLDKDRAARTRVMRIDAQIGGLAEQRLRSRIEAYRLVEGEYPERLNDLIREEIADEEILRGPFVERFSYRRTATGFLLATPLR